MQLKDISEKTWEISTTSLRRRFLSISRETSQKLANQYSLRCLWDPLWNVSKMHLRCIHFGWGLSSLNRITASADLFIRIFSAREPPSYNPPSPSLPKEKDIYNSNSPVPSLHRRKTRPETHEPIYQLLTFTVSTLLSANEITTSNNHWPPQARFLISSSNINL